MEKNSKLKKSLIVLFILSLVFILGFAATYITSPLVFAEGAPVTADAITVNLESGATLIGEAFVLPFPSYPGGALVSTYGKDLALVLSIVTYVVSGLILILIVLSIVFVCNKKKPLYSIYSLAVLVALYIAYIIILTGSAYLAMAQAYFAPSAAKAGLGIFVCVVFALGILAFLSTIATVVLGLIYSAKHYRANKEPEPEEASVAELAGDPEAVQEGEELNNAPVDEVQLIESEPEPLPEEVQEVVPEVEEEKPAEEPKVEEEPKEEKQNVEVNINNNAAPQQAAASGIDQASLATLLREVVRDIVRDEIARNNLNQPQQPQQSPNGNQTITGATFGGPLVVQYFNGGINGVTTPNPAVVENKSVEKVVEIRKEEPAPAPQPAPEEKKEEKPAGRQLFQKKEVVEQSAPAPAGIKVESTSAPAPAVEEKKYERLTFAERLLQSEIDVHDLYNELKNEILSYGVKSRISAVGDTFRLHKKMYVRITVAGKSLKLYFALNPADYCNSALLIQDASAKDMYQVIPLVFKVKSPLSVRRCKELIQDVMEKDGLEQGEIGKVNWVKELKAELASGKKPEKED